MNKIRRWLILLLIGKWTVIVNARVTKIKSGVGISCIYNSDHGTLLTYNNIYE